MNIGFYAKSIIMVLAAGVGILTAALSDGVVSATEFVNIAIAIVTAVGVYLIPNLPAGPGKIAKFLVAAVGAGLQALVIVLGDTLGWADVSSSDWLNVLLAALAAVGLYIVPNVAAVNVEASSVANAVDAQLAVAAVDPKGGV